MKFKYLHKLIRNHNNDNQHNNKNYPPFIERQWKTIKYSISGVFTCIQNCFTRKLDEGKSWENRFYANNLHLHKNQQIIIRFWSLFNIHFIRNQNIMFYKPRQLLCFVCIKFMVNLCEIQ